MPSLKFLFLLVVAVVLLCPTPTAAFGAGNIASISKIEGHNWRHGDIEDMLKTVACLKGHKWSSMMIKRVYFGNWLRDYSQAVDVGTLKGVQKDTIRILVWILAFMSFGYATGEFEVTEERLGVYRAEEHIDNPKGYADNTDARQYDQRLRGPVLPQELAVDPNTGMKNYIANETGGWATSAGYIRHSFTRAIHYGRVYTHGSNKGKEEDLCEALRCLGQGLHCLEDFGAHTNYTELALRELGFHNVFPHTGTNTQINLRGKHVFPLVTGTFGGVDFLHSVLGEANDHFTQSDVDTSELGELNQTLANASTQDTRSSGSGNNADVLVDLLSKVPGTSSLCKEAKSLQATSDAQAAQNAGGARGFDDGYSASRAGGQTTFAAPPGSVGGPPGPGVPGMNPNFDPQSIIPKIYPILAFRDKVVRAISGVISKIPGLEALVDKITERVTMFVFALLAPFIQPIIKAVSASLKQGSSSVIDASGKSQYEPWTNPNCDDPTHSMLSKDHFSNILNEPAGQIAATILQYVAPRVMYAWDHPNVPVEQVLDDVVRVFHHPAARDHHNEVHQKMFAVVERWVQGRSDKGHGLNNILSSESVREGKNHAGGQNPHNGHGGHSHGPPSASTFPGAAPASGGFAGYGGNSGGNSSSGGGLLGSLGSLGGLGGNSGGSSSGGGGLLGGLGGMLGSKSPLSGILGGSGKRDVDSPPPAAHTASFPTPPPHTGSFSTPPPAQHSGYGQPAAPFQPYGDAYGQPPAHGYQYQQDAPLPPGPPQANPADPYAFPSQYQQGWRDEGPYGGSGAGGPGYGAGPGPGGYGSGLYDQQQQQWGQPPQHGGGWGQQPPAGPPPGGHWGGQY
ncbi:uncharacterized protein K452DRAFT_264868 [Aplosporella prunicola CBS 121167]|uniref:Het-C-domain-containing protein n=1 Tax=Aplosporella prunicola CBS 121167 TaxID=1176127 RepID=A0A6A6BQZ0_9PEZI|nr:uncharacterized protein K452DRAFT_264868 [Aplosporella prunicola CBS 121167]KAF2145654.1 hypothetical protein K452DRAFT_264868 [Aplosporella prunicola CBS 121167]